MSSPDPKRPGHAPEERALAVVHCFRPLVGGVFRHVLDLARGQAERGHRIGIICDSQASTPRAEAALSDLVPLCALGVHRLPITRRVNFSDLATYRRIAGICAENRPDIVHGHGAKGGAFARLLPSRIGARVVYTPHGGVLHYDPGSLAGRYYFALERYLRRSTDGLIFVSEFGREQYRRKVAEAVPNNQVIYNGLRDDEFTAPPNQGATYDFVFAGELRMLKGVQTLLEATARVARTRDVSLRMFGAGPDSRFVHQKVRALGLESVVTVSEPVTPVTTAFAAGRTVVVPSHSESFPYIVLEAIAAGMPLIGTDVGGIPEIFGEHASRLIQPGDADALADAMAQALDRPGEAAPVTAALAERVRQHFRVSQMVDQSLSFYRSTLRAQ